MVAVAGIDRRTYWLSAAALVVALPAALYVNMRGSLNAWLETNHRVHVPAEVGTPIDYAGASWTVTRFTRIASADPARVTVLVEFDALAKDPAAMTQVPCRVRIEDGDGREWKSVVFGADLVRKTYPEAAAKSGCGGPAFEGIQPGQKAEMAATFTVPANAEDLSFSLALLPAIPDYLYFREPRS